MRVNKHIDTKNGTVQIQIADGSGIQIQIPNMEALRSRSLYDITRDILNSDRDDHERIYCRVDWNDDDEDMEDEEDEEEDMEDEEDCEAVTNEKISEKHNDAIFDTLYKLSRTYKEILDANGIWSEDDVEHSKAELKALVNQLNHFVNDFVANKFMKNGEQ